MKLWMEHGEERKAKGMRESHSLSLVLCQRTLIFENLLDSFDVRLALVRDEQGESHTLLSRLARSKMTTFDLLIQEYRNSRPEDYQRSVGPQDSPAPRPAQSRPEHYANLPPNTPGSTAQAIGYSPFQPVISFPPPPPLPLQQQSTTPIDPFYASYGTPWRPDESTSTIQNDTTRSLEVATPGKAGIHPSRLAILAQTGVVEQPVARSAEPSQAFDTGSNVVQEKRMIEETTKNAYGARKRRAESDASSTNMPSQGGGSNYAPTGNESVIVAIRGAAQSPPIGAPSIPGVSASPTPQAMNDDYSMVSQSVPHDMPAHVGGGGGADSFLNALNLPPNGSSPIANEIMNPSDTPMNTSDTSTVSSITVIADSEEQSKESTVQGEQDVDISASAETKTDVGGSVEEDTHMESQEEGNKGESTSTA